MGFLSNNASPTKLLKAHFRSQELTELRVTTRTFARRMKPDLQMGLNEIFNDSVQVTHFSGLQSEHQFMGLEFGALIAAAGDFAIIAPPDYEPVDIGEDKPIDCLKIGFWLFKSEGIPYAAMMAPTGMQHADTGRGIHFSLACRDDEKSAAVIERFFSTLEHSVAHSRSYRGKVLSLEGGNQYTGRSTEIAVQRLTPVRREELILPKDTVELLERNVIGFCRQRAQIARFGQSLKKGVLFYGPPGTGKTYTIRYLAGLLPDHTTFLITAEQVGLLPEYMLLARLLQPSIVVIEDADLIARDRNSMGSPCEEVMLNKLLNEMDGLREDARVLFILTTNRPQALEGALAARPGRIDQAIEFPPPDAENRAKLARIYAREMPISDEVMKTLVDRTEGVSASFIKELMRRSVQFWIERQGEDEPAPQEKTAPLAVADVDCALEEILFKGGSLNRTLLGGVGAK